MSGYLCGRVAPARAFEEPFDREHATSEIRLENRIGELGGVVPSAPGGGASAFLHPREVLEHPGMAQSDKRALLAGWASDACAVEGRPAWRQIPGSGALVPVDDILEALQALDRRALH